MEYLEEEDKSVYLVNLGNDKENGCGHSCKGKFPTNLKAHLRKKAPSTVSRTSKLESDGSKEENTEVCNVTTFTGETQMSLHDVVKGIRKYSMDSEAQIHYKGVGYFSWVNKYTDQHCG